MRILQQVQLKAFNTLNLDAIASHYVEIKQAADIVQALEYAEQYQLNVIVLSGGSNILLPQSIDALVMHMQIQGIESVAEDAETHLFCVGAGQVWHDFVLWSTAQQCYGLQNLALIPGLVGASPVQNIGAYGVEAGEFIERVEVYDRQLQCFSSISHAECQFAYRDSIFKHDPTRYVISHVVFRLLKQPQLKINYGDLKTAMATDLTPENLQRQVIKIRQAKLPDPKEFANVGSFFKNPLIEMSQFSDLIAAFPTLPHYSQANDLVKVAAGWLIEQAGWKGKRLNRVGMFHQQALVLVNYADANLAEVQQTYRAVQQDVYQMFGICLEPEPVLFNQAGQIQPHQDFCR